MVMTAAVESLHRAYPGRYRVAVNTTCPDIWKHNPRVEELGRAFGGHECAVIELEYPLIHKSNDRPVHFMQGFCDDLASKIGVPVPLSVNRPSLYLSDDERQNPPDLPRPYVVVNAGTKDDFTAKGAGRKCYQDIADHFRGRLTFVQIGEAHHLHKPLDGVINLIGKTSTRELFRVAHHSAAGVGPITFLHHVYAALGKPYVCYMGGREPLAWEQYQTAVMLSTHGRLPCCQERACWKSRTVALNDGTKGDKSLCALPVLDQGGEWVPKCMELLGPCGAIEALENMMETGVIKCG